MEMIIPLPLITFVYVQYALSASLSSTSSEQPLCPTNCTCNVTFNPTTSQLAACEINCMSRVDDLKQLPDELNCYLSNDAFRYIVNLTINSAQLTSVPTAVCQLRQLETLNLTCNQIRELRTDCFDQLPELINLYVSFNNISKLTSALFDKQTNLSHIDLNYNEIEEIDQGVFTNNTTLKRLKTLNLHHNHLKKLDIWPIVLALVAPGISIDLSNNDISEFTDTVGLNRGPCTIRNVQIYIDILYNKIDHVSDMFYGWGFNTTSVDFLCLGLFSMKGKPTFILQSRGYYVCDCTDYRILLYNRLIHDILFDSVFCRDWPATAPAMKLTLARLEDIECKLGSSGVGLPTCPVTKRPWNRTIHVQCSNAGLSSLPDSLPECPKSYRYKLDFSGNNITVLEYRSYFANTAIFDITDNPVQRIDLAAARAIEKMGEVYLSRKLENIWPNKKAYK